MRDLFGTPINDPDFAWLEGFPEYFAQRVAATDPPGAVTGGTPTAIENPPLCTSVPLDRWITNDAVERHVAAAALDGGGPGRPQRWRDLGRALAPGRQVFEGRARSRPANERRTR